jgi:hypothetical protein
MWERSAIYLVAGAVTVLLWYLFFVRSNRHRADRVMEWVHAALAGKGQVVDIRWLGPSVFHVALRLSTNLFAHPALLVRLVPREMPLKWLRHWWHRQPATITFEADLDIPPSFNLQVRQHRWSGRSSRRISPDPDRWFLEHVTPLIMTSSQYWQREVTAMMNALLSCRNRELLSLGFRRSSPHFSATIPLKCISPEGRAGSNVFDMLRELAAGASASRM